MVLSRRTKQQCRLWAFISITALIAYYVIHPFIVNRYASPLFCDESVPCQNNSVSFYPLPLASNEVVSCQFSHEENYAIVIVVPSRKNELERRDSIRRSWGKKKSYRNVAVATFFLIASEKSFTVFDADLLSEAANHGDMIFADMRDSYQNLTLKILHGLTWAKHYCHGFNFLVKVDSDVFFNVYPLIDYFYERNYLSDPDFEFVGGSICENCRPRRAFFDQWAISYLIYPHPVYPDYTHGPCYVISRRTVGKMVLSQPYVRMIPYEDVYFTGIVAGMYLKTRRVNIPGFMGYSGRMSYDLEQFATTLIATHKHSIQEVERWWGKVEEFRRSLNIL